MMNRLTLDQLRKSAEERIGNKRNGKIRVVICYTSCSIGLGANKVLKTLQETLVEEKLENVVIETTGCMGLCSKEPLVDVYMPDGRKFSYEFVTSDKARRIVISHAMFDTSIEEWLFKI